MFEDEFDKCCFDNASRDVREGAHEKPESAVQLRNSIMNALN